MSRSTRRLQRRRIAGRSMLAVIALLGAMLVGVLPRASAVTSHRPLNDTRAVGPAPVTVAFPIEFFGVVADLPQASTHLPEEGRASFGEARFRVHGAWTAWQPLGKDGAQAPGRFTGALLSVDRADAYQVRGLPTGARAWRAAAINTTDGPPVVVGSRPASAAAAASGCRSRADWGADESISGWAKGDTQTYYPVQVLTVHHTAGSNSPTQDYSATVRAIYSYHVQSNGWSDIGYQYLVDGAGTVYEGRNSGHTSRSCLTEGGDGSDFAHQTGTDDVVTGAHVGGYNSGNAGIALMGCFEPTSACSGTTTPSTAAVDGLERLLASLSSRHGLDPTGSTHFVNPVDGVTKDVRTISGHRDWLATECPGAALYGQLPTIRSDVAARMTPSATPPAAPAAVTATLSGTTATVAWSPPASDGGSPVTRYEVFRGTSSTVATTGTPLYSGTATSTTDAPPPGSHWYGVRACNAVGCGPTATAGPVTVAAPAAAITSASCKGGKCSFAGTGVPTLRWAFGNGATATGSPVSTTYRSSGSYTVRLTDGASPATTATRAVSCRVVKRALQCTT